jgi:putative nucleotidyltransferase with HDIG domain
MSLGAADPTLIAPRTERWLPHAIIATAFVVVVPALVVWMIVPSGEPALLALSVPLGMLLSVLAAALGGALWKRAPGSRDLVFADLMLWGWLRRLRAERRLAHAETLLGTGAEGLSVQALTDLSALLEARDTYTYGHSLRVTRHAERIAKALGLPEEDVARVRSAAALHDVGKLHTPREILNKPERLTEQEFAVIRRHPADGAALASSVGDPAISAMIRHHHERLDGAGYPHGLAGAAIPLGARIIAVADTFDAMTSNRAYRRASSHKRALDVLRQEAGKQLDVDAVAAFVGYYRGRRTVVWSAFATAAPQRLFAWLGGISSGVGAGAAGAAALAVGVASPPAPVLRAATAMERVAPKRAEAATPTAARALPVLAAGLPPTALRATPKAASAAARPKRKAQRGKHKAKAHKGKRHTGKAHKGKRHTGKAHQRKRHKPKAHKAKPRKAKAHRARPVSPVAPRARIRPQKAAPRAARPRRAGKRR